MKKLLLASLLTVSGAAFAGGSGVVGSVSDVPAHDASTESGWNASVGLGVVNAPTFAGVDDTESTAVPLINVSYNDTFYFEYNKLGAWLWKPDNTGFRIGVVVQPRKGYDKGDGPLNREIDDTALAGVRMRWQSGKFGIDASLLGSSEEDSGGEVHITAKYTFLASTKGSLTAMVKLESMSEDAVDYFYYASTDSGADSATNASIGVIGTYNLTPKWMLIGGVLATSYDDSITDAPGVTEDTGTTALIGATYKF